MELFNLLIENERFLHNVIYTSFREYLKINNIKEATLYYDNKTDKKYINTKNIIENFIDFNYKTFKKEYIGHVKKEASYIREYLIEVYWLDCLPF